MGISSIENEGDYLIKVTNKAELIEALELAKECGYKWCDDSRVPKLEVFPWFILLGKDNDITHDEFQPIEFDVSDTPADVRKMLT